MTLEMCINMSHYDVSLKKQKGLVIAIVWFDEITAKLEMADLTPYLCSVITKTFYITENI